MYAIKMTEKNGESRLLRSPFNLDKVKPVMTFDKIEEAEANLAVCESVAKKDTFFSSLEITFEIVNYEK